MKRNTKPQNPNSFTRRQFLQASALGAAGAFAWSKGLHSTALADEEPVLNAFMLPGYEESGMLDSFEEETGIKVNLRIGDGHEQMFSMMQRETDEFDVSCVTSAYIQQAAKEGLLQPLDEDRLPLDRYMEPLDQWSLNYHDGRMYALINRFGYYGLTYNTNFITAEEASSYEILFDPKVRGRVALFDWHLPNMGVIARYLGYEDPFHLEPDQFAHVKEVLSELRPQVGLIGNNAQTIQGLASQDYWITIAGEWVHAGLEADGLPYAAQLPQEGGVTWDQSVVVLKNARHPHNAMKFIEYMASAQFQAKLAVPEIYYSMVPNVDAVELLTDDQRRLLNLHDLDVFRNDFLTNLSPREFPPNFNEWMDAWSDFRG